MSPARRAVLARSLAVLTLPQGLLPRARAAEFTTTAGMRGGKSAESAVAALPKHVTESLRWLLFSDDCGVAGHEWV